MDIDDLGSVTISVVTATCNCAADLRGLCREPARPNRPEFRMGDRRRRFLDRTLELLRSIDDIKLVISSQEDFGIYDALNRALCVASGSYYLVAGADDRFANDAIANFRMAVEQHRTDLVVANVDVRQASFYNQEMALVDCR